MIYSLGMFGFERASLLPDQFTRRADYQFATTPRFGARDAAQYAGVGTETITMAGSVYREIADGAVSIQKLREMAESGDSWSLVDGAGRVYGAFVIRGIDEKHVHIGKDGTPLKIEFTLDLLRVEGAADSAGGHAAPQGGGK